MSDSFRRLVFLLTILLLVLAGGYYLYSRGIISANLKNNSFQPLVQNNQTRTVVQDENAVISAVEKTSPSVVAIGVNQRVVNPFSPFSNSTNQQDTTIGTGFVVSDKGIIVTNRHVVSDTGTTYSVVTKDGKKLTVSKIYRDPNLDLALLQIDGSGLTPLELGDSSQLKVGQTLIAIGNALGRFDNTVTTGVVSGLGRAVAAGDPFSGELERLDNLIQTDAAINPGNSGGPLLNSAGQVIGVNVATTEGAQNIGFAIPINSVKSLVDEFNKTGTVSRPYLGIRYRLISRDLAILNELPQGAYIQEIIPSSPADKADINVGDIITKINNQQVTEEKTISDIISNKKVGDSVSLEIWSNGQTKTQNVTLEESTNL